MNKCIQCGNTRDLRRGWTMAMYCSKRCEVEGVSGVHGSMPGCGKPWLPLHIEREIDERWKDKEVAK